LLSTSISFVRWVIEASIERRRRHASATSAGATNPSTQGSADAEEIDHEGGDERAERDAERDEALEGAEHARVQLLRREPR
jgi:hypothetical protein